MTVRPAEAFTPGEYLANEIEARAFTQAEFARRIGRPAQMVNEIIKGKKAITAATALDFERALDVSAECWLGFQMAHDLWTERNRRAD